jgi:putative membrane protein
MRIATLIAWLVGVALLGTLVALNDPARVLAAMMALKGWLLVVMLFHAVPLAMDAVAWHRLFAAPPPLAALFRIRWIAEGVNGLLPVPHLGEVLRADLARRIARPGEAGASVVVDVTLGVATQVLFACLSIALFSIITSGGGLARALLIALAVLVACALTFYLLQRAGMFALVALFVRRWSGTARRLFDIDEARALDGRVRALYSRRGRLFSSALWRFAGWITGAGEIWLILWGLGRPIGMAEAIMLEGLSQTARTAAFVIPGGLGVQDGALLVLCGQLGLGAEIGLALALAKRARELILGLPALLCGYVIQARRLAAAEAWRGEQPPA